MAITTAKMYNELQDSVKSDCALRCRRKLQPAGGVGDKVFPPTYAGGKYAMETRIIEGERYPCVILDSVQSQANRMELALLSAHRQGKIQMPVISVDFAESGFGNLGSITTLETPHRIADAIFRDSVTDNQIAFPKDAKTNAWLSSTHTHATELYKYCPTGLLFGLWFNPLGGPGNRGVFGTRFARAITSEIFGVNVERGVATSSQSNPLQLVSQDIYYNKKTGEWRTSKGKGKDEDIKSVRLSEVNHGAVTPDFAYASGKDNKTSPSVKGGVTMLYALQTSVISLSTLRKLSFPDVKGVSEDRNIVARTVLSAMGLCAATLVTEREHDLRSRCVLVPEELARWEIIKQDGNCVPLDLTSEASCELLQYAVKQAKALGLTWLEEELILKPSLELSKALEKSRNSLQDPDISQEE